MINQNHIEQYCSYFKTQLGNIDTVRNPLYQKILLVVLLDTWARAKYPSVENNKKRFVNFIDECAGWEDCNRVSLPLLSYRLEECSEASKGALVKEVTARLGKWQHGRVYRLAEADPLIEEIAPFATTEGEHKIVKGFRHSERLYVYRNHLVHEFREPGYGMEISDDDSSPYYHGMTGLNSGQNTWELVYPTKFFKIIAKCSLDNLERYLRNEDLDPYSFYKLGSVWE